MISIWHFPHGIRSQVLALSLVIVMMTMALTTLTTFSPLLVQSAYADHGQEIMLTSKDTSFAPVSSGEGNQVKVVVNYAVHDPVIANDLVKGVMKVYSPDGTLLKTSSSPTPFPITNSHGTATFATTLTDPTIENVIAKIVFTNPIKTEIVSNELPVSVSLIKNAALTGEPEERAISQVPQESEPKEEEQVPDEPLPEDKLPLTASSEKEEEEQQSAKIEDVPVIHQSPQMAPTESQTMTSSYVSPPPPPPQTMPEPEICNDSIDNDVDTLIDMSDTDCNPSTIQQQQQQQATLQQEPVIVSSPEICDDDLDNDLDSKIDSSDEECSSIASSMSSVPLPRQAQSVAGEQIEENEDEDKEQELDEGSEESGDEENNNDENEDEDEDEE
jgi:hypothetical protein